jgi:SPP1 family phage portal protein
MADINVILENSDFSQVVDKLCVDTIEGREPSVYVDEYNGLRTRRETSTGNREDKYIDTYSETEMDTLPDGTQTPHKTGHETVVVAKIVTNLPKKIVRTASAFLFGGNMNITFETENEATDYFRNLFSRRLKMKYIFKEFARILMTETKAALLFYPRKEDDSANPVSLHVEVLKQKNGEFYPHFNDYGDMDGFIRRYTVTDDDDKEITHVWIQTAEKNITAVETGTNTWEITTEPNLFKKISVVYVEQDAPEWDEVATLMDTFEMRLSRLADTNDYFSEPIMKSYGATNLPSKKTVGKQIEFDMQVDDEGRMIHGDADYLTWTQSVESVKLELETMKNEIYSGSSTPDLSFDNLKGIGNISGIAMKFMFMDAFIKAEEKMEIMGKAIQRTANVVVAGIANIIEPGMAADLTDNECEITFDSILPEDLREEMEVLAIANGYKAINSRRTVTARSQFTRNVEDEIKQMSIEEAEEQAAKEVSLIGGTAE